MHMTFKFCEFELSATQFGWHRSGIGFAGFFVVRTEQLADGNFVRDTGQVCENI